MTRCSVLEQLKSMPWQYRQFPDATFFTLAAERVGGAATSSAQSPAGVDLLVTFLSSMTIIAWFLRIVVLAL